jgi:hypothetical protein
MASGLALGPVSDLCNTLASVRHMAMPSLPTGSSTLQAALPHGHCSSTAAGTAGRMGWLVHLHFICSAALDAYWPHATVCSKLGLNVFLGR